MNPLYFYATWIIDKIEVVEMTFEYIFFVLWLKPGSTHISINCQYWKSIHMLHVYIEF